MPITLDGTSGVVTPAIDLTTPISVADGGTGVSTGEHMFRNRIINGAMGIWQRGTSVSGTYAYGADRWATLPFATATMSQSSDVPTAVSQFSLKLQRSAGSSATTGIGVQQTIESRNCYDLSGQTVTISFWAKAGANFSSSANALGVQFITGTTADQGGSSYTSWTGQATVINVTATLTTSWQRFTYTGICGANVLEATAVFFFTPTGTAGADDSFFITGVQLEKGSTATSFEYRPYGTELQLCQRYFLSTFPVGTAPAQNVVGSANIYPTTISNYIAGSVYPVQMRASPTITTFNPYAANSSFRVPNSSTDVSVTPVNATAVGIAYFLGTLAAPSGVHGNFTASAEL